MHQERKELYYDNCRYWSRAVGTTIAAELKAVLPDTQLIGRHNKTMTYFPENTSKAQNVDVVSYDNTHHSFDVIIIAVKTHQLQNVIKQLPTIAHKDFAYNLSPKWLWSITTYSLPTCLSSCCLY